jgi:hypothetical protein
LTLRKCTTPSSTTATCRLKRLFRNCEPVHTGFLRTSLHGLGTFQGN